MQLSTYMNILLAEKFKKHMLAELLSVDCSMHSTCIAETQRLNTLGSFAANDILSYLQYTYYP